MNSYITTWKSRREKEQKRQIAQLCGDIGIAILLVAVLYVVGNLVLGLD